MKPSLTPARHNAASGFSLVEVLVGMVIALIGIVIMFQVMENADARKRTTAAGGDAQIAGSIAMYNLERDIRQGGYGFGASAFMGCTVNAYDTARGAAFTFPMIPVQIVDGAAGAPDQIIVFYGNSQTAAISQTFGPKSDGTAGSTTTSKTVTSTSSRAGIQRGDLVLVANSAASACGLIEITDNSHGPGGTTDDARTVNHTTGTYTSALNVTATARFNDPAGFTLTSGSLYNLGNLTFPRRDIWQITNNRFLTVTDDLHFTGAAEVGEGIIDLQAEYGLDLTGTRDYLVDTWQTTDPADWTRVIAIRVGLLARSQQYEKAIVTPNAPTWTGGTFVMTNVDGTADDAPNNPNDWRHYRYRVYEVTIPLRNVIWGTAP